MGCSLTVPLGSTVEGGHVTDPSLRGVDLLEDLGFHVLVDGSGLHRLTHSTTNEIITVMNFSSYVASGNMYNSVALGCMQHCHDKFDLETVETASGFVLTSKDLCR